MTRCGKCRKYRPDSDFHASRGRDRSYCKQCARERSRQWRVDNADQLQERRVRLKTEVMEQYGGGHCACCEEDELAFLTLDHVNGGGNAHRRLAYGRGGVTFYAWLKDSGWPDDPPLQVLCSNCNAGRQAHGGVCPHQSIVFALSSPEPGVLPSPVGQQEEPRQ